MSDAFDRGQLALLERIASGAPLRDVLEDIVRLIEQQADGMLCSILILDRDRQSVHPIAAPHLPPEYTFALEGERIGPQAGSCGTAAFLGQRVIVEDIATHPYWTHYKDLALPHGLLACWSSPIFSPARDVLGTFAMYYPVPRGPTTDEIEWVDAATHLAAIAILRDQSEQSLRQSEARHRQLVDTAYEGVWTVDLDQRTTFVNRRLLDMLGYVAGEMLGRSLYDFIDPAERDEAERSLARRAQGVSEQREVRLRRKDGALVWAIVAGSPIQDEQGRYAGALGMVTDITERKAVETRAHQLARLYAVSSSVNEAIVRVRDAQQLYELACRIAVDQGLAQFAWVGVNDDVEDRITPVAQFGVGADYLDRITLSLSDPRVNLGPSGRAFRTGTHAISHDIASDPHFYWAREALDAGFQSCAVFPLKTNGRSSGIFALYVDRSGGFGEEELRVLTALADDISFAVDSAANEQERQRLVRDLGERVKELTLLHRVSRLLQTDRPFDAALVADLVALFPSAWQYPEVCEARIVWRDLEARTPRWRETPWQLSATFTAGRDAGTVEVVYLEDKTGSDGRAFLAEENQLIRSVADMLAAHLRREHMEDVARAGEKLRALIYGSVTDVIFYLAVEPGERYRFLSVNDAFLRATALTEHKVAGRLMDEVIPEPSRTTMRQKYREAIRDRRSLTWEEASVYASGTRLGEITVTPILDATGRCTNLLGTVHDITARKKADEDRRELEAQLHQAQRMQSLGTLAGGIAHDFNNVLAAIGGHLDLAVLELEDPAVREVTASARDNLAEIRKASRRAKDLVRQILMFSRQDEPRREVLSLPGVVEEAVRLLRATLPASVSIRMRVDPGTPNVMADSSQIHQILMNLGTNALHAIGERGGAIDVSLTGVELDEHETDALPGVSEGRYARVSLADNGSGIEPATLSRVFEPFFTTKPPGQGTGLGLSVVHGIMQAHNGAVTVQSWPGQGTTFHLYFPAADAAPELLGATQTEASQGKGEHVLYVDDEEALVFLATRMLRRLGYHVTGLSDSTQALQEFRTRPHAFDVVVTDTSMPGLSGLALVEQILSIRPDVPVVLVSGYFRPEDIESAQRLGVKGVIFKPHSAQELSETIRRVIGRRDSSASVPGKERLP